MKQREKEEVRGGFILATGWLFADLLLALAMIFLAANAVDSSTSAISPTSPPGINRSPGAAPATPGFLGTPATPGVRGRVLESNYCRISLSLDDPDTFATSNNIVYLVNQLKSQIDAQTFLRGRQVGITIAYGGENDGNITRGTAVARQTYTVLQKLGQEADSPFSHTSYYDPLLGGEINPNQVIIDVYLVALAGQTNSTC